MWGISVKKKKSINFFIVEIVYMSLEFSFILISFSVLWVLNYILRVSESHWEFSFPFPQVKVLHNQLILFHNAIAAYFAGNQQQLEQTLKQFHIKLKLPGGETPSWLEEHWLSQHSWNMCTPKGNQIQKKSKNVSITPFPFYSFQDTKSCQ